MPNPPLKGRPRPTRFMQRILRHPRLPFTQLRYHASKAADGSGPYRVVLFNKGTPTLRRLLDEMEVTINRERKNTRRSWNFARGWAGDFPSPDHLGAVSANMYDGFDSSRTQFVASDYLSLVAILQEVSTGTPLGLSSFGFTLALSAGRGTVLNLTCYISDVWISKAFRNRGLSSPLREVVAHTTAKYISFLDSGFESSEAKKQVDVLFEADAVSLSGHRYARACANIFRNQAERDKWPLRKLKVAEVRLDT